MLKQYNVVVVGATGVVGEAFLEVLAQRNFPIANLYALASERSLGDSIRFGGKTCLVTALDEFDFSQAEIAFFSVGAELAAQYAPKAAAAGCIVIDNSAQFRYDADVPLVVPEVNSHALVHYRERNIIANPNCSTIQMVVALKPIYDRVGIKRIHVSTYQAVSGAGRSAIEELAKQTADLLNGQPAEPVVFPKQIAFNVFPQIDRLLENGYTKEEMKLILETQKILEDDRIAVFPTAVRVPVFYGHSESVHIETEQPISAQEVIELLKKAPGVQLMTDPDYPTALDVSTQDNVMVGRIHNDLFSPNGVHLWIVGDNVRKGAALNAVQIAELLMEQNFALH